MKRLTGLLVGLGQIGCGYDADLSFEFDQPRSSASTLSHARAIAFHPGFVLQAGVDPSPAARQRFTQLYGAPAYADLASWRTACPDALPDLVVVAVPPQLQLSIVETLLVLTQPRMLLLEKPLASDLQQARAIQAVCNRHPLLSVAVNYVRNWLPAVQAWRRRLQSGELGRLLHGQLIYGKGLLSNGSHFVNLAEAWLGPLMPGRMLDPGLPYQGFDRELSLELLAADHRQAPLQVRCVGAAGLRAGELDLWFEGGRLCWPDHGQAITLWPCCEPVPADSHVRLSAQSEMMPTGLEHHPLEVFQALYRHFRNPNGLPLHCALSDAIHALEILTPSLCK